MNFQYLGFMPRYFLYFPFVILLFPTIGAIILYKDWMYGTNLLVLLIGVVYGILNSKRKKGFPFQVCIYLIVVFMCELLSAFSAYFYHTNTLIYHIALPLQFLFLSLAFEVIFDYSLKLKKIWRVFQILVFGSFWLISNYQGFNQFPSLGTVLLSFIIVVLCLFTLKKMALSPSQSKLRNNPYFWFVIGCFVFYSITFFVCGYLYLPEIKPEWTYTLLLSTNIFIHLCFFVALYKSKDATN